MLISLFISSCELRSTLEPTVPDYVNPEYPHGIRGNIPINFCYAEDFAVSGDGHWVFAANRVRRYIDKTYVPSGGCNPYSVFYPLSFAYTDRPNRLVASYFGDRLYCNFADRNTIHVIDTETMAASVLCESADNISEMYLGELDEALIAVYFTIKQVDFFNATTGELEGTCSLPWTPIHSTLSPDKKTLAVYGAVLNQVVLIDVPSMSEKACFDTGHTVVTFSFSGDNKYLVFFIGSSYKPAVNRYSISDGEWWGWQECNRFYTESHPIPGTACVAACRDDHDWLSVLNAENMIFAPPLECPGTLWGLEVSDSGERMFVMTRWPHIIRVFQLD